MLARSAQLDPNAPERPSGGAGASGAALVIGDDEALLEEVFSRGRRGVWLHLGEGRTAVPPWPGISTRPLRPGGVFDWPCGTFALIVLGGGIERLDDRALAQLGRLCLSSLDLHGEIQLCLDPARDANPDRVRRALGRVWPLLVIRRHLPDGTERYAWRRTVGILAGGALLASSPASAVQSRKPRPGGPRWGA